MHISEIKKTAQGTYMWRYRDPSGRQRSKNFKRRADAVAFKKDVEADLHRGEFKDPKRAKLSLEHYYQQWAATRTCKAQTKLRYDSAWQNWLEPLLGHLAVGVIEDTTVLKAMAAMQEAGAKPGTIAKNIQVLRLVLGYAQRAKAIYDNPARQVRTPKAQGPEKHFLNAEQIKALANAIEAPAVKRGGGRHGSGAYPAFGTLIRFVAMTGLRAGEAEAVRVRRLHIAEGEAFVTVEETLADLDDGSIVFGETKNYATRRVPIPDFLLPELRAVTEGKGSEDLVFVSPEGEPIRHRNFYRRHYKRAVTAAGLPAGVRFHDLRHTFAALMISRGAMPRELMELMGHSSIAVTINDYGHVFPGQKERLTAKLNDLWLDGATDSAQPQSSRRTASRRRRPRADSASPR